MNLKSDAKIRRVSAESKDLTKNFFELLRRCGESATKGEEKCRRLS